MAAEKKIQSFSFLIHSDFTLKANKGFIFVSSYRYEKQRFGLFSFWSWTVGCVTIFYVSQNSLFISIYFFLNSYFASFYMYVQWGWGKQKCIELRAPTDHCNVVVETSVRHSVFDNFYSLRFFGGAGGGSAFDSTVRSLHGLNAPHSMSFMSRGVSSSDSSKFRSFWRVYKRLQHLVRINCYYFTETRFGKLEIIINTILHLKIFKLTPSFSVNYKKVKRILKIYWFSGGFTSF